MSLVEHETDLDGLLAEARRGAYLDGIGEGTASGYALAGGDAVAQALAVRGDIAAALEGYAHARWTHEGVDTWARVAHDLLETLHAAISGEDSAAAVVIGDVVAERARQDMLWGEQDHPNGTGPWTRPLAFVPAAPAARLAYACDLEDAARYRVKRAAVSEARAAEGFEDGQDPLTWGDILTEEVFEAYAESDPAKLRAELVQIAAVAVQWAQAIDRRAA